MVQTSVYNSTHDCTSEFVFKQVANCRLRVKHITPRHTLSDRPVIVFLHEGLGCIEMWRDYPEALCSATRCNGIVYDRKGYGGATRFTGKWPYDYLISESSVYLPGLLAACDVRDAILVGHSDGGSIVLLAASMADQAACRPTNIIRGGITEAAHIFIEEETVSGIRTAVKAYESTNLKERLARYHGDNTEAVFRRWSDTWLDPTFHNWNIERFLPDIRCPLLVIQGEKDEYATKAQVTGIASQVSGPVQVELIPDCGHIPHFSAHSATLEHMTGFIDGL